MRAGVSGLAVNGSQQEFWIIGQVVCQLITE